MALSWEIFLLFAALLASLKGCTAGIRYDERWLRMLSLTGCPSPSVQPVSVYLSVSSLASTSKKTGEITSRLLELNWFGDNKQANDKVALYDHDPDDSLKDPLLVVSAKENPDGYHLSKVHFPYVKFEKTNLTSRCLNYWIGYISNARLISSSCIRAEPFWMKTNRKYLEKLRLREIMIPGTHDSGSYERYLGTSSEDIVIKYTINQEETIFNQLAYGIRSLDLRIGFYNDTPEKFWINHRYFNINHTLSSVLKDVRDFIEATEEIVILDFHHFPVGFPNGSGIIVHRQLRNFIKSFLEPHMLSYKYGYDVKLGDIWASKHRILVAYNYDKLQDDPRFWPPILQVWGNKQNPESLKKYFMDIFSKDSPMILWNAMAEMTPTAPYMVLHPLRGLRVMAENINRNVTQWFRTMWWRQANIVSTDFFLGNDMINVAIEANKKKMMCLNKSLPALMRL